MRTEVRMAGFGGQGIITMGKILGRAALYDGRSAFLTEDYGPEKMGGWSKADLVVGDEETVYPLVEHPDILIALSQDGFERFQETVKPEGRGLFEEALVHPDPSWTRASALVPALRTAEELGRKVVANIVMLGAVVELTQVVTPEAARRAVLESIPRGTEELNEAAFRRGRELAKEVAA